MDGRSGADRAGPDLPDIRIVRGDPTDAELAAVLAVLGAVLGASPAAAGEPGPQARSGRAALRRRVDCVSASGRGGPRRVPPSARG